MGEGAVGVADALLAGGLVVLLVGGLVGWRGEWDGEGVAYGRHADLVAVGDVGVGCESAGLCDGVTEGWGEEVEEGEGQGSDKDAVDHCEGWVLGVLGNVRRFEETDWGAVDGGIEGEESSISRSEWRYL